MAGRLSGWQNVPGGSPNATASFRYDGEGERVAQQSTTSGTTTTRYLLGGLEELTTVGSTSTLTKYYSVPGVVTAIKVGTTLSYLATDGLGSVSVALSVAGSTTGQALYLPYGAGRYSSGSMPTARGYTGQYQDSGSSGLDYYGARYYDPTLGQFTSADSVLDGLNRYAYVHGNPTTATDPTGHRPAKPNDPPPGTGPVEIFIWILLLGAAAFNAVHDMTSQPWPTLTPSPGPTAVAAPTPQPTYPGQAGGSWTQEQLDAIRAASLAHRPLPATTPTGGPPPPPPPPPPGPQQPSTSSGTQQSWGPSTPPEDGEPAPEPATDTAGGSARYFDGNFLDLATLIAARWGRIHRGGGSGCPGLCRILSSAGTELGSSGIVVGHDPGQTHAEAAEFNWAFAAVQSLGPGAYTLQFLTYLPPCSEYCQAAIPGYEAGLTAIAPPGVTLTFEWWYLAGGQISRYYP